MTRREYIEIGPTPCAEACAQVGDPDYRTRAFAELRAYIAQLRRQFGIEPDGAVLSIKSFPHDLGTYHEVVCYFDPDKPETVEYAYKVEREAPDLWDATATITLFGEAAEKEKRERHAHEAAQIRKEDAAKW